MQPWKFLQHLDQIVKAKQTGRLVCCWCHNQVNIIKWGVYWRYSFSGDKRIAIQRYYCKHDSCRRTFSLLPHPFLRITRFSLCMLVEILRLITQEYASNAEIARRFDVTWPTIARAIQKGDQIMSWIDQETKTEPGWEPSPCMKGPDCWSNFIPMFAAKFYPKRYGFVDQHN